MARGVRKGYQTSENEFTAAMRNMIDNVMGRCNVFEHVLCTRHGIHPVPISAHPWSMTGGVSLQGTAAQLRDSKLGHGIEGTIANIYTQHAHDLLEALYGRSAGAARLETALVISQD